MLNAKSNTELFLGLLECEAITERAQLVLILGKRWGNTLAEVARCAQPDERKQKLARFAETTKMEQDLLTALAAKNSKKYMAKVMDALDGPKMTKSRVGKSSTRSRGSLFFPVSLPASFVQIISPRDSLFTLAFGAEFNDFMFYWLIRNVITSTILTLLMIVGSIFMVLSICGIIPEMYSLGSLAAFPFVSGYSGLYNAHVMQKLFHEWDFFMFLFFIVFMTASFIDMVRNEPVRIVSVMLLFLISCLTISSDARPPMKKRIFGYNLAYLLSSSLYAAIIFLYGTGTWANYNQTVFVLVGRLEFHVDSFGMTCCMSLCLLTLKYTVLILRSKEVNLLMLLRTWVSLRPIEKGNGQTTDAGGLADNRISLLSSSTRNIEAGTTPSPSSSQRNIEIVASVDTPEFFASETAVTAPVTEAAVAAAPATDAAAAPATDAAAAPAIGAAVSATDAVASFKATVAPQIAEPSEPDSTSRRVSENRIRATIAPQRRSYATMETLKELFLAMTQSEDTVERRSVAVKIAKRMERDLQTAVMSSEMAQRRRKIKEWALKLSLEFELQAAATSKLGNSSNTTNINMVFNVLQQRRVKNQMIDDNDELDAADTPHVARGATLFFPHVIPTSFSQLIDPRESLATKFFGRRGNDIVFYWLMRNPITPMLFVLGAALGWIATVLSLCNLVPEIYSLLALLQFPVLVGFALLWNRRVLAALCREWDFYILLFLSIMSTASFAIMVANEPLRILSAIFVFLNCFSLICADARPPLKRRIFGIRIAYTMACIVSLTVVFLYISGGWAGYNNATLEIGYMKLNIPSFGIGSIVTLTVLSVKLAVALWLSKENNLLVIIRSHISLKLVEGDEIDMERSISPRAFALSITPRSTRQSSGF